MLHQRIITFHALCLIGALTGCSSEEAQPAGAEAGTDAGAEGGPKCHGSYGHVNVKVQPAPPLDRQKGIIDWSATGRIAASEGASFTLDTCHPDANCVPTLTTVTVSIPPEVDWPLGAYVTLHYLNSLGMIPTAKLSVQNAASWDGKSNPVSDSDRWYLIATDGYETHPDAPFEVAWTGVDGCPENFAMRVRPPGGEWTTVTQGESTSVVVEEWRFHLTVVRAGRPLQGYDYPPPFAWWATSTPVE